MKVLKILLCLFLSLAFTNIGKDVHVEYDSFGVENFTIIEVVSKDGMDTSETACKALENIRYSFYRGYRDYYVKKTGEAKVYSIIMTNVFEALKFQK